MDAAVESFVYLFFALTGFFAGYFVLGNILRRWL